MRTDTTLPPEQAAPIVQVLAPGEAAAPAQDDRLGRARAFAANLLAGRLLDTGEDAMTHADGVAGILYAIGAPPHLRVAAYLVYAGEFLQQPREVVTAAFGEDDAQLVELTRKLVQIQRAARGAQVGRDQQALQLERVRKMLLAFSRDLRVVLLRLASRLQTLRWHAGGPHPCPEALARETLQVFAPLANRLGIWQIKWELEDLAFRFLHPGAYREVAAALAETRVRREADVEAERARLTECLKSSGVPALVQGRPKHLWSIWKKMQGKGLDIGQVFDMRAMRVIVADVPACYAALSAVRSHYREVPGEYDDYIARPKPNGYQSLHTVVLGQDGRPLEIQIRTQAMHEHAEHGVAAHWAYKEAGTKGYGGVSAGEQEARLAEARKTVLRQLLAWERDAAAAAPASMGQDATASAAAPITSPAAGPAEAHTQDGRTYVFTPQAAVVELGAEATPVDFAYALHTDVGHRCRGAKVDGAMVPLNTALANGQTVEIITVKEGGPSLDWLNPELGYLRSPRARAKVRAWFHAREQAATVARGREAVEKLLQREGRTATNLEELAGRLGFKTAEGLFEVVGKDEYSLRHIEQLLRPAAAEPEAGIALKRARAHEGGVLVVGVESLLTSLARCCRPAPPDPITGYVTRGKGVAIHRSGCSNLQHMAAREPDRLIQVAWGAARAGREPSVYPVDVVVEAHDRQGLLRDISEVFAKDKVNVIGVQTQTLRRPGGHAFAQMQFTVEVADASGLAAVLRQVAQVPGVRLARRR